MEHINSLLSLYHQSSLQPYYSLSPNYLLGVSLVPFTSYLWRFLSHYSSLIQKFLHSLSWTLYLHSLIYVMIFYGLLFLIYFLRAEYVSSLYLFSLYAVFIFFYTILLSLLWVPSLAITYQQHFSVSSKATPSFSSVLTFHLSTLSVCSSLSILLIIFLFSLMMYPLSLESDISLWVFYCGLMISVLYGVIIVNSVWLLIVLCQGNLIFVYDLFFFSRLTFFRCIAPYHCSSSCFLYLLAL